MVYLLLLMTSILPSIPAREANGKYRPGEVLDLRVSEVKEDGKMNVTDRQKAYIQINEDAQSVLSVIEEFAGVLPLMTRLHRK